VVKRITMRFRASGAELRAQLQSLREAQKRCDRCRHHQIRPVDKTSPLYRCDRCESVFGEDYVRAFVSGVLAGGGDPSRFVADYPSRREAKE
jgi:hypothetical protein